MGAATKRASSAGTASLVAAVSASRRNTGTSSAERSSASTRSVPAPWRATESEPQASQRSGTRSRWPQWWQAIACSARCRTSATSQFGHSHAFPHERQVRKFDQPRRLSSTIDLPAAPSARRVSGCSAWWASRMSSTRTGGRSRPPATRAGSRSRRMRVDGLRARRGGAGEQARAGLVGAVGGDVAGVVARVALLLVGRVVLLVDDDQPEPLDGREDRGARADGDPRLAAAQPPPLVVALALRQRGVQERDGVAEARGEARDGLRRERDLRHERDHALAALERRGRRAQVDLGLARAGDAVQQVRRAGRGLDRRERVGLGGAWARPCGPPPGSSRRAPARPRARSSPARAPRAGAAPAGRRPPGPGRRSSSARWRSVSAPVRARRAPPTATSSPAPAAA